MSEVSLYAIDVCHPPHAALYSSGSNVIPMRARPGLARLGSHTLRGLRVVQPQARLAQHLAQRLGFGVEGLRFGVWSLGFAGVKFDRQDVLGGFYGPTAEAYEPTRSSGEKMNLGIEPRVESLRSSYRSDIARGCIPRMKNRRVP